FGCYHSHTYFISVQVCSVRFFFFQAEDGIRDFHVTGVQTCALPILVKKLLQENYCVVATTRSAKSLIEEIGNASEVFLPIEVNRSEERRVGKECRSRWRPSCQKKKDEDMQGG